VHRLPLAALSATALLLALLGPPAGAADEPTALTWSYEQATHQLVGPAGTAPFRIKGGTPVMVDGEWAVKFTTAPNAAAYTGTSFPRPGADDFAWTAVMSLDYLRPRSTANVAQYGRWSEHQIKLQLSAKGVPQCVLNGSGGRVVVTSAAGHLNDGGRQHAFTCWRQGGVVGVTVDCASTSRAFPLGAVAPVSPPTIGNHSLTSGAADQLYGKFWRLTVASGPGTGPPC
jgi:hypothetical protein